MVGNPEVGIPESYQSSGFPLHNKDDPACENNHAGEIICIMLRSGGCIVT